MCLIFLQLKIRRCWIRVNFAETMVTSHGLTEHSLVCVSLHLRAIHWMVTLANRRAWVSDHPWRTRAVMMLWYHDDIIAWKYFPYYWPCVIRGIPVDFPSKNSNASNLGVFLVMLFWLVIFARLGKLLNKQFRLIRWWTWWLGCCSSSSLYTVLLIAGLVLCFLLSAPDGCASNPCMNGGVCSSQGKGRFQCSCSESYTGQFCQSTCAM